MTAPLPPWWGTVTTLMGRLQGGGEGSIHPMGMAKAHTVGLQ